MPEEISKSTDFKVKKGLVVSTTATVLSTTNSNSTTTGALIVSGGAGIGGNLWVGGEIVAQKLTVELTTVTTTLVQTDDIIRTSNTTSSISTTTGALIVSGGAGIGGNLYVGGTINGNIVGTVTGTATTATQIQTTAQTANASYFMTFVDANNASAANEIVYTTSSFTINPSTGNVTLRNVIVTGNITGTSSLSLYAGGTNQNISLLPSGTGQLQSTADIVAIGNNYNSGTKAFKFQRVENKAAIWSVPSGSFGRADIRFTTGDATVATAKTEADATVRIAPAGGVVIGNSYLAQNPADGILIASGNIGIGITSPTSKLHVAGDAIITGISTITNTTSATSTVSGALQVVGGVGIQGDIYARNIYSNGVLVGGASTTASQITTLLQTSNASHFITFVDSNNTTSTGELVYTTSSFVINPSTGNVGVGITSPTSKLHVSGDVTITGITTVTNTTNATSTTTGAVIVVGGAGIGGNLYVHGNVDVGSANTNSSITVFNTTTSALSVRSVAKFVSPNNSNTITVRMLDSDVLSFSGDSGQLFSISDSFTGTIFAVNDISGVPSIEVYDTGLVSLAEFAGNVGIGTTSTTAKLDVNGTVRISGVTTVTNTTSATSTVTGAVQIAGGVGIGGNLYVGGSINGTVTTTTNIAGGAQGSIPYQTAQGQTAFIGIGANGTLLQSNGTTATWVSTGSLVVGIATSSTNIATAAQTANAAYYLTFVSANNATAAYMPVFTTASFVVNPSSGNVGIGTASPISLLDVAGNTRITGITTVTNTTNSTSTTTGALIVSGGVGIGGNLYVGGTINGNFVGNLTGTATNSTLFDGQTSTYYLNYRNLFNKPISSTSVAPTDPATNDLWWDPGIATLFIRYDNTWVETTPQILEEISTGTYRLTGSLVVTEDLTVQGTLYETSDQKLKKNIETISDAVDTVEQMRGVTFDWVKNDKPSMGLIAQEVEKILPYLVDQDDDGHKSINYTAIIGLLVESIKELNLKIEELKQNQK